jgi:hypothetical protein
MESWKTKTLIIGAVLGAISGAIAALVIIQRSEENKQEPHITAGDGVKVGLGVLGVLRLLSDIGGPKR